MSDTLSEFLLLEPEIKYFKWAYMGPLMRSAQQAGTEMMERLAQPHKLDASTFFEPVQEVRELFSSVIDCPEPERIALIPSASYGLSNLAHQISLSDNENIVIADGQFPSNRHPWTSLCNRSRAELRSITRPADGGSWSQRLLDAICKKTKLVSVAPLFWEDGTLFDLEALRQKTREVDALLIVDGSQAVGAMPISVRELQPDALVCAGYKWLFSPYGASLAYIGPRFNEGVPMEQSWLAHQKSQDFSNLGQQAYKLASTGMRFSAGQHPSLLLVAMQRAALEQVAKWNPSEIQAHARSIFAPFEGKLLERGFKLPQPANRAPHLFGLELPPKLDLSQLHSSLEQNQIAVSIRGSKLRVCLHLFNSTEQVEALVDCLLGENR